MCSCYNSLGPKEITDQIAGRLGARAGESAAVPQWNIAPTDPVQAIVLDGDGGPELRTLRWGLLPAWTSEVTGPPRVNARLEGLQRTGKAVGVSADSVHRALIPAGQFIEWSKAEQQRKTKPAPFGISLTDGQPFCFAGLWASSRRIDKAEIVSCTIITVDATGNPLIAAIHDRMPAILAEPSEWRAWLATDLSAREALTLCRALLADRLKVEDLPQAFNDARTKSYAQLFAAT